jgi:uncharacterized phage-associated protein
MAQIPPELFRADQEKIIESIIYIASAEKEPMHYMKVAYLIYFADKTHLELYGRTITGDAYIAIFRGIVPARVYINLLNKKYDEDNPNFHRHYNSVVVDRIVDLNEFSESDIEILDRMVEVYSKFPLWQLQEFAKDSIWRKTWEDGDKTKIFQVDILDIIESVDDLDQSLLNHLTRDADDPQPNLDADGNMIY